jgi:hypothetical protein
METAVTVTQAIHNFLNHPEVLAAHNYPDLIRRWMPNCETQVNVIRGEKVEGLRNTYTDGNFTWSPIRIPAHANSEPEWIERKLTWPLDVYVEGIGVTGWNFVNRVSVTVGYDFDSLFGHGVGLTDDELDAVKEAAMNLDYVEVRKSSGGAGIHLEVHLENIPTRNHTEHARLAKLILEKMSRDCNFEFASNLDVCGSVLWIWHRKATRESGGLALIKAATRKLTESDLPTDWTERIASKPRSERPPTGKPANVELLQRAMKYAADWGSVTEGERNKSAFRLAGHLAALENEDKSRLNEGQIFEIMRVWNMTNNPPLDEGELHSCVTGGVDRGTPREPKVIAEAPKEIRINHELHRMVHEASDALADADNVYQHGGTLVEVVDGAEKPALCLHDNGSPQLVPLPKPTLGVRLSECVSWTSFDKKAEKWKPSMPVPAVVAAVHVANHWPRVPMVTGIASCPVLRADGTIAAESGYDRATGLYIENVEKYPPLMEPDDAVKTFDDVLVDFPFHTPAHRSAWLSFLITMLARPAFAGTPPLHLFDANAPGVGKGLITDAATMIVEGRKACRYSWSKDNEETRKLITTVAMSGSPYLLWDNVKGTLGGAAIEQMMTTGLWADRILSMNRQVVVPIRFVPAATANNCRLTSDMVRRVCHCYLKTDLENPAERTKFHHTNLLAHIRQQRPKLVMAALSIAAGYMAAGKPDQKLPGWGSFEEWSDLVRGSIVWADLADPAETRAELRENADNETEVVHAIIHAWPPSPTTVSDALKRATELPALGEALAELPERNRSQELGNLLRTVRDRSIGGKRIVGVGSKPVKWQVVDAISA